MRPRPIGIAVMMALACSFAGARASVKPHYDDAPLQAVQFVDREVGWAVGDDGVIWHTIDGGQNWERQSSGVRPSLRSVHFFNTLIG